MPYLLAIGIALLGLMADGNEGLLFGALIGTALAISWVQRRELAQLRLRVDALATGAQTPGAADVSAVASEPTVDDWTLRRAPAQASAPTSTPTPTEASQWTEPKRPRAEPSAFEQRLADLLALVKRFFTTGNLVVRVGVIVLFFGVAFLLRYAYDNSLVPVELRLVGTALGGIVLAIAGWKLRHRADTYGLVLQGAGVGLLYLTIFAAARLYEMLPMAAALAALIALVAASSILAVLQNSQALAIFSMSGGFLAPVLVSTGAGSHVALFSYYALLNAGILGMAWFRHWRWLNWVGFVFTFAIGGLWGFEYYEARHFATIEPFLVLSFFYYLGVSVLFARRNPIELRGVIDGTLVFGMPVIAFAMQAALVQDMSFGLAFSALGAAATYTLLALWLKRQGAFATLLGQSFVALGVGFATLAIPFAFDDQRFTAATWALEGAGLVWVGLRQRQVLPRVAGMALQMFAALAFLSDWSRGPDALLFANSAYFGAVMLALGAGFTGYLISQNPASVHRLERLLALPFLFWGVCWWLGGGGREIAEFDPSWYPRFQANRVSEHLFVLFAALSFAGLTVLSSRLDWRSGLTPGFLLLPLAVLMGFALAIESAAGNPLVDLGWLAWPLAIAAVLWHLRSVDSGARLVSAWHAGWWWAIALFAAWLGYSLVNAALPDSVWSGVLWGLAPLGVVAGLLGIRARPAWPLAEFPHSYYGWGMLVMAFYLLTWTVVVGMFPAAPDPMPYLVLLNPLELVQLGILLTLALWTRALPDGAIARRFMELRACIALVGFVWLNLTAARAVHAYGGVPYPIERIVGSDFFQTTISILWTVTAVVLMSVGARRASRRGWIVGAALLGLVIAKLFVVDLSNLETMARIVSFVTVGVLMLVIGYLAPLPPSEQPPGEQPGEPPGESVGTAEAVT
jgi:uncharacterized membrane protein